MKGKLVVFEGLDNVGKTSQLEILKGILTLDQIDYKIFKFPDKNSITGNLLDSYNSQHVDLDPRTAHLLFSANRWEKQQEILHLLSRGFLVLVDRYFFSGCAYSCGAHNLELNWCIQSDSGMVLPDLVFYCHATEENRLKRSMNESGQRYDSVEVQRKIHNAYTVFKNERWVDIDCNGSIWDISLDIQKCIKKILANST